jgi:hypothetical protein
MKFHGIVEGALTKEHFLELIDWVEAHCPVPSLEILAICT